MLLLVIFVGVALYFRSNLLTILGMLAFGWVLVYVTNNEAILFARSFVPVGSNNIDFATSLFLGFGPAIATLLLTRRAVKKPHLKLLSVLLIPAMLVIGWMTILLAVSYDQREQLLAGDIHQNVVDYQEYALWVAAIAVVLYLYFTKPKAPKEDDKKKK